MNIPFCKSTLGEEEKRAINEVIDSGWVVMGNKTCQFEEDFATYVGSKYAVFVDSGTSALFLALRAWQIHSQDEVIVPSLTFTSTAEVVVQSGGIPIFKDVDLKTMCLEGYEGGRSVPVHLAGIKAGMKSLIYDSAHRIEKDDIDQWDPALWCYSFYATKNMTTIQGGAIALNDKDKYEWLKSARDHGITAGTEERYKKGISNYEISFVGWREKSDDIHAAIGLEQLKKLPWMTEARNRAVLRYNSLLELTNTGNHIYPILVKNRPYFLNFMKSRGIQCSVHFLPLHKMPAYKKYAENLILPNTEYLGERLVSIPLYPQLSNLEIDYISQAVLESKLLIKNINDKINIEIK